MANREQLAILRKGAEEWNRWKAKNPRERIDLSKADLSNADLSEANFNHAYLGYAKLDRAKLRRANLIRADLRGALLNTADLREAKLMGAYLHRADLDCADLTQANLAEAYLTNASCAQANFSEANLTDVDLDSTNLTKANLIRANLSSARLVKTNMTGSQLSHCRVYGLAAWDVRLEGAIQANMVITPEDKSAIEVDNLEVAQFIYLLLNNEKLRSVIDTITSKVVLILGRFTQERKPLLEAIRDELRKLGHLPLLFDFDGPRSQTTDETIATLAHLARFVIADLTDAKSVLQELRSIVPNSPSVIVQPILLESQEEPGMFDFFRKFPWVLAPVRYTDQETLLANLKSAMMGAADAKAEALTAG